MSGASILSSNLPLELKTSLEAEAGGEISIISRKTHPRHFVALDALCKKMNTFYPQPLVNIAYCVSTPNFPLGGRGKNGQFFISVPPEFLKGLSLLEFEIFCAHELGHLDKENDALKQEALLIREQIEHESSVTKREGLQSEMERLSQKMEGSVDTFIVRLLEDKYTPEELEQGYASLLAKNAQSALQEPIASIPDPIRYLQERDDETARPMHPHPLHRIKDVRKQAEEARGRG